MVPCILAWFLPDYWAKIPALVTIHLGILFLYGLRIGVRRREHCDLREVISTILKNGYELVQQWLRVRRQASLLSNAIYLTLPKCRLLCEVAIYIPYLWEWTQW